ncbi:UDP-N-acetyl-D-galactosamine dehydrogenase [Catalinimonas alkaloidigena]|uniref:UDP-N-acetyl-D-galactosamine dehydrogenase n=1 Tax=Catalinimonas alkaloidigena TaxID=1075417 RepID=A0A1G9LCI6_9BACT|nr:nucleotide sugar dehydrogenase [Catalinimonas alkaloidigena]SDL59678.1 UDP-N-acetyl-D-galactosamine dehydrogenase [Catalinimonas alkaloidigena]
MSKILTFPALQSKQAAISVIGLGYVGLPIALALGQHFRVIGFDHETRRIDALKRGQDLSGELPAEDFRGADVTFTDQAADLQQARFHIVAVPTPIDSHNNPDLRWLEAASRSIGNVLQPGDVVVYESTVYPGCTEEVCVPILEATSGLTFPDDFKVGYSPERINPGDRVHTLRKVTKVVAGCDQEALAVIAQVYETIVEAGLHCVSSIKVAEAAKVIENTQRDLNIALMNELSMVFDRMGINTHEVLEAAGTKWNFLKFTPGLVGGHCVGVDPYYLTYKSQELGHLPKVILSGRQINDGMAAWVAKKTVQRIVKIGKDIVGARVLVLGIAFKENVRDIRNSKVADLVAELRDFGVDVDVMDPLPDPEDVRHEYGIELIEQPRGPYEAIVLAVAHTAFEQVDDTWLHTHLTTPGVLIDLKGELRARISEVDYWSL